MSYYKKSLVKKYFLRMKYARRFREYKEEMDINDFEERCFHEETWNYLI